MKKKSPLKAKPLRLPGQSLQEQIDDFLEDQIMFPYMGATFMVLWAGYEWAVFLGYMKRPHPLAVSFFAVGIVAFATWKLIRGRKKLKILAQARDGERAVGQYLESLRAQGHHVFHDILGERFNLDHVVIGPQGVFTIETKTLSKPLKGEARVVYDGDSVRINGYRPQRDPIAQAKAQAHWLKELFQEETGKTIGVQPIVVYPGWYIDSAQGSRPEVWVLNPKALPPFIAHHASRLVDTDIHLLKSCLSRRIRQPMS